MALAITYTGDWLSNHGDRMRASVSITFDSSYPTGGEPLTRAQLGMGTVDDVRIDPKGGYVFEYDYANQKVLAYVEEAVAAGGPLLEVTDTTNLSAVTGVRVVAVGRT